MREVPSPRQALPVHRAHRRTFADHRYVYPVVSRRSRGVSIGINLNPDKICNFDCIYCQVDRKIPSGVQKVEVALLLEELEAMLDLVLSDELFKREPFQANTSGMIVAPTH